MKKFFVLMALALSAVACKGECGDGVLDAPNKEDVTEACDDSAAVAGDGCDATCAVEAGFECEGAPSVCALSCSDGSPDAGEQCDDGNGANLDGCSVDCQVENGFECNGEPSVCNPLCGNGTLNAGELCDDGNAAFGDGCDGACFIEGGFECDGVPSVCIVSCGDATLDPGELCDDGNVVPGDGCAANCLIEGGFECVGEPSDCAPSCGDATLDAGEECDDANLINADGCNDRCEVDNGFECAGVPSDCTLSCGDATIDLGEQCDDDNVANNDGCNANCQTEAGFFCDNTTLPSVCTVLAGCPNGTLNANEECDDDNAAVGDGCDASCQIEPGFLCITPNGQSSVCQFVCGNGVLDGSAGENCDDGNIVAGDGCDAVCVAEPGFTCTGTPSTCTGCGNNISDGADVCDGTDLPDGQGGQLDCTDFLFSAGILGCAADCTDFDLSQCQVVNGDGVRTPGFLVPGVGEQCDDGNVVNGDGCSSVGLLENTTTVVVNANQAQLNNTTAVAATKTVFGAMGGVDLNNDGLVDALFDVDQNGTTDASVLIAVSTDRADICDVVFQAGGFNGFLNAVFAGQVNGTIVLTLLQIPAAQSFAANTFVGATPMLSTANSTSVDAGYIITNNGNPISDTTLGGLGTGNFGLQIFNFNPITLAGTINFFTQNVIQSTQFIPAQAAINQPITVTVNGAPSCTLEFLQ